jgi:hypothetical protein
MEEFCLHESCHVHQRTDIDVEERGELMMITYVGNYAVHSVADITTYDSMAALFVKNYVIHPSSYHTQVYEVGMGSISDVMDAWEAFTRYHNETFTADETRKLHLELVDLIKAGKFNGEDL